MSSFFDSPFEYCDWAGHYVLLDQTQGACSREHRCGDRNCPLARWFGPSYTRRSKPPAHVRPGQHRRR
jgi:hypothetical protein